jgi:hypothetical protein
MGGRAILRIIHLAKDHVRHIVLSVISAACGADYVALQVTDRPALCALTFQIRNGPVLLGINEIHNFQFLDLDVRCREIVIS